MSHNFSKSLAILALEKTAIKIGLKSMTLEDSYTEMGMEHPVTFGVNMIRTHDIWPPRDKVQLFRDPRHPATTICNLAHIELVEPHEVSTVDHHQGDSCEIITFNFRMGRRSDDNDDKKEHVKHQNEQDNQKDQGNESDSKEEREKRDNGEKDEKDEKIEEVEKNEKNEKNEKDEKKEKTEKKEEEEKIWSVNVRFPAEETPIWLMIWRVTGTFPSGNLEFGFYACTVDTMDKKTPIEGDDTDHQSPPFVSEEKGEKEKKEKKYRWGTMQLKEETHSWREPFDPDMPNPPHMGFGRFLENPVRDFDDLVKRVIPYYKRSINFVDPIAVDHQKCDKNHPFFDVSSDACDNLSASCASESDDVGTQKVLGPLTKSETNTTENKSSDIGLADKVVVEENAKIRTASELSREEFDRLRRIYGPATVILLFGFYITQKYLLFARRFSDGEPCIEAVGRIRRAPGGMGPTIVAYIRE